MPIDKRMPIEKLSWAMHLSGLQDCNIQLCNRHLSPFHSLCG